MFHNILHFIDIVRQFIFLVLTKKYHSQAKTHREACGGGYLKSNLYLKFKSNLLSKNSKGLRRFGAPLLS